MRKPNLKNTLLILLVFSLFLSATASALFDKQAAIDKLDADGIGLMASLKYKKAIAKFSASLKIAPDNLRALANRAISYQALGKYDEAIHDYNAALAMESEYGAVFERSIGSLYIQRGRRATDQRQYAKAEADFKEAERYEVAKPAALSERAFLAAVQKKYDECEHLAEEAVQIDRNFADAWITKGNCQDAAGHQDKAIASQSEAIRVNPASASAFLARAQTFGRMHKCKEARRDADQAFKLNERLGPAANHIVLTCR